MTSVARSVVTCQADADVSLPPPLAPLLLLPSLTHLLSPSPSFSRSLSLSPSPSIYLSLSFVLFLSLTTLDTEDAIRSTQPSPSRIRLRVTSPLGLTRTILPPSPPSSLVLSRALPRLPACLPACCPPAGLILVIVPASILNPPFPLALFSSDTSGVISPFSMISYRFSSKVYCIT